MILMKYKIKVLFILLLCGFYISVVESDEEEDLELIVDWSFAEDNNELIQLSEEEDLPVIDDGYVPKYSNGIWICGKCDKIDESKLIYSEVNDVEANVNEQAVNYEFSLAIDNMQCITVKTDNEKAKIRRVAGSCNGSAVTFSVSSSYHFIVKVFA